MSNESLDSVTARAVQALQLSVKSHSKVGMPINC